MKGKNLLSVLKNIADLPRLVRRIKLRSTICGSPKQVEVRRDRGHMKIWRTCWISLLPAFLLTGCVAAVVAGAASSLVVYDKRTMSMVEKDARIFHVLRSTIVPDPRFRNSHIVISSFNGVVLLAGQTPDVSLRGVAQQLAQHTPNVQRVYNEITIDYPLSLTQQSQDTWLTAQVRSRMLAEKGLESGSLRVITENGVVYLMGIVTPEQADLTVNVTRQVKGVRKVVKVFQYIR